MTVIDNVEIQSARTLYLNMANTSDSELRVKGWRLTSDGREFFKADRAIDMEPGQRTSELVWLDHPYQPLEERKYEVEVTYAFDGENHTESVTFTPTPEQLDVRGWSTEITHTGQEDPAVELIKTLLALLIVPFYWFVILLEGEKPAD